MLQNQRFGAKIPVDPAMEWIRQLEIDIRKTLIFVCRLRKKVFFGQVY